MYIFLILIFEVLEIVYGRGRMIDPPHRGSMWRFGFDTPHDYNDMSLNCGGIPHQWKMHAGKCGLCGDPYEQKPYEHESGGKYATGTIARTYLEGQKITITIELTANKQGWFEFRLCDGQKETQDCFDKNLLKVLNGDISKYDVKSTKNGNFSIDIELPQGLVCSNCVLQFKYHAGNNYGTSKDGKTCLGCAEEQEEVYNCADIEIKQDPLKIKTIPFTSSSLESPLLTTQPTNRAPTRHSILSKLILFVIIIKKF